MKTKIVLVFSLTILSMISNAQSSNLDNTLARVIKVNNKPIFYWNEPINDYEVAFKFLDTTGLRRANCMSLQEIVNIAIKNANIEAINQEKIYDAIIIGQGNTRDMAITFKDKSKDNMITRASKCQGKLVFLACEPLLNYEVQYKDAVGKGSEAWYGYCPDTQAKIDKLIKRTEKKRIEYDGVIIGLSEKDMAIKFK